MNEQISNFLSERIAVNDFPSAVYLVAEKGEIVFHDALGFAVVEPERIPARLDTIYDVASLTKPLVTGLLSSILLDRQKLQAEAKVASFIPDFIKSGTGILIMDLLCHTAGLAAWKPLYIITNGFPPETSERIVEHLTESDIEGECGASVVYSDLNFIVLGYLMERVFGESLNSAMRGAVSTPLDLRNTCFSPNHTFQQFIAASE